MFVEALSTVPRSRLIVFFLIVVGAVAYLGYSLMVQPVREEDSALNASIESLTRQVGELQSVEARLTEFRAEVQRARQQLEEFRISLPDEKETPFLMDQIQELAVRSDLHIRSFTPQPTMNRDFYMDWPIRIELEGSYHNLGLFFEKVSQMGRLVNIGQVSIKALEDTSVRDRTIGATCVATTFVFQEGT